MSYATLSDMITRFGEQELVDLTDRADGEGFDREAVEAALKGASARVDGYIGRLYSLPLAETPDLLVDVVCDIARYRLCDKSSEGAPKDRYDDALRLLKDIAKGLVELPVPDEPAAEAPEGGEILAAGQKPFFDHDDY